MVQATNFKTDITALSDKLESTFQTWAVPYLAAEIASIQGLAWLSWPVISPVFSAIIAAIVSRLVGSIQMRSMILHTAIRKAEASQNYLVAKRAKDNLPPTATEDEVRNAERLEMSAFTSLVVLLH